MTENAAWTSENKFHATRRYEVYLRHFRSNMPLRRHRRQFTNIDDSFTGQEATDFMLATLPTIHDNAQELSRENCVRFLQFLMTRKVFCEARGDSLKFKDNNNVYKFIITMNDLPQQARRARRSASCTGGVRVYPQPQKPAAVTALIVPDDVSSPRFGKVEIPQDAPPPDSSLQSSRRLSKSYGNLQCHVNNGFADEGAQTPRREVCTNPAGASQPHHRSRTEDDKEKENLYDWLPFQKRKKRTAEVRPAETVNRRSVSMDRNHMRMSKRNSSKKRDQANKTTEDIGSQPILTRSRIYESMKLNAKRASHRSFQGGSNTYNTPLRSEIISKNLLMKRFDAVMPNIQNNEWREYVNGRDAQWNCLNVGQMGVVKPRLSKNDTHVPEDYPTTMVKLMTFLEHFPVANVNVIAYQNGQEINMFNTLCERLPDVGPALNQREVDVLLEVCFTVHGKREMMSSRRRVSGMRQSMGRMFSSQTNLQKEFSNTLEVPPSPGMPMNGRPLQQPSTPRDFLQIGLPIDETMRLSRSNSDAQYLQLVPIVFDEADYHLECINSIAAINMVLMGLPTLRRRRLHRFVRFIRNIVRNHCLRLDDLAKGLDSNWKAAINGLWKGVCDPEPETQESPTDVAAKGILLTAILVANERAIFVPDPIFMADIQRYTTFIDSASQKTQRHGLDETLPTAMDIIREIEYGDLTEIERKKALKKLKKSFPDVYATNYGDEEKSILRRFFKR